MQKGQVSVGVRLGTQVRAGVRYRGRVLVRVPRLDLGSGSGLRPSLRLNVRVEVGSREEFQVGCLRSGFDLGSGFAPDALGACNQSDFSVVWLSVNNSQWRTLLDIGRAAFRTSLNLLSNTIFSKDLTDPFSDSDKEFKELVWNIMAEAGKPNLVDFFPFLKKIDPQGIRRRLTNHFSKVLQLMSGLIDERLKEREMGNQENVDVLDALLSISPEEIDRNHIEHLYLDLFVAGTDTTSNTLEWAMAELLKNPHTLEKAQKELAQVIGRGKLVDEADVAHLTYLQCIVKEALRLHPPVSLLIPLKVEEDVELCGYTVPKGSQVLVNPERFWESEIDVRGRDFELIPFGAGRRIYPGLPLAISIIPVTLGSLINTFNWKLHGGIAPNDLDMDEKFGITLAKAQPLLAIPTPV
ncbi:hypothetical protein MTR67_008361 [Solanum verrucosum]|uniref:Geraniol 10-hydroxylase n=1 Tax=Solanum verrucosum TaxID=315347 RepID=A0AAF0TDJ0_SOLVR|nr:hypothetical protein MTR67_008361 [Solanum verrucosum]